MVGRMRNADTTSQPARVNARALVVDDDPIMRDLLRTRLSTLVKHVDIAADGADAMQRLSRLRFHVAIIDLMMPGIDGFTLIKCIRSLPATRHMPIVVITSNSDSGSLSAALETGATAFMTKPVAWSLFSQHMQHLLRQIVAAELAELDLSRHIALSRAHGMLLGELSDLAHSSFRRLGFMSSSGSSLDEVNKEAVAARLRSERLHGTHAMIRSFEVVNGRASPFAVLLGSAQAQSAAALNARGLQIVPPDADELAVVCSESAIVCVLTTMIHALAARCEQGSQITVAAAADDASLAIRLVGSGAATSVSAPAALPESAGHGRELALARVLAAAHGGAIMTDSRGVLLRLPWDRAATLPPRGTLNKPARMGAHSDVACERAALAVAGPV